MINKYDNGTGERRRVRKFSSISACLPVKPLSVNKAYTGRKRRSIWLKTYTREVMSELPEGSVPRNINLQLDITFGVSNRSNDADNLLKPLIDCLQEKYDFNDNQIFHIRVWKKLVKKGNEYINWQLNVYNEEVSER